MKRTDYLLEATPDGSVTITRGGRRMHVAIDHPSAYRWVAERLLNGEHAYLVEDDGYQSDISRQLHRRR